MDDILVQERREAGAPSIDPDRDRVGFYFYTAAKVREVKVFGKPAND